MKGSFLEYMFHQKRKKQPKKTKSKNSSQYLIQLLVEFIFLTLFRGSVIDLAKFLEHLSLSLFKVVVYKHGKV